MQKSFIKQCVICKEFKTWADFHKSRNNRDGRHNFCKKCRHQVYIENRDRILVYQLQYYKDNREDRLEYQNEYNIINLDVVYDRNRQWTKENPDKKSAIRAQYRATKAKATPDNISPGDTALIAFNYKIRDNLKRIKNKSYHVDHIVPISKNGLHSPDNLMILTAYENLTKHAKLNYTFKEERIIVRWCDNYEEALGIFDKFINKN